MARKFAVIGLGTFGFQLACELENLGGEVLAIDRNAEVVQDIRDHVTRAIVCDALDRDNLREVGVADVDAVIIGLRSRLDSSILVTMYVQELGVSEIVVQAVSDDHRRALEKLGAAHVIFPEKDMASRVAGQLMAPNLVDFLWAAPGYGIVEIKVPSSFLGKSLLELNVRQRHGVTVIAVRSLGAAPVDGQPTPERSAPFVPTPAYVFRLDDMLILFGKNDDLQNFPAE
jgi:trk system potassium uptake protein TrkA